MRRSVIPVLIFLLFLTFVKNVQAAGADVNSDGKTDIIDIGIVIDNYGRTPPINAKSDINSDGSVNIIDIGMVIDNYGKYSTPPPGNTQAWENGSIRYLPEISGDIAAFVAAFPHPKSGYAPLSPQRESAFNTFFSSLLTAVSQTKSGTNPDWCGIKTKAQASGYSLSRFYDTKSGRYYIYAKDISNDQQAHFFLNPASIRDIVIEAPHAGYEANTDSQGARLLTSLSAKALLINGGDRCSTSALAQCSGSSSACGAYKASDVAHDTRNTFHKAHVMLSGSSSTKFTQLHGMGSTGGSVAETSDGSTGNSTSALSNKISVEIRKHVPNSSGIYSCQEGTTPAGLCGTSNLQGRFTNGGGAVSSCGSTVGSANGRFIHIEQVPGLRDDNESDGLSWKDVNAGLLSVWSACGPTGCLQPATQTKTADCNCGSPCN